MKLTLKLVVVTLLSLSLFAENTPPIFTHGLANGRYWAMLNKTGKAAWVDGYQTGLQIGAQSMANLSDTDFEDQSVAYLPKSLTIGEITGAIDRFYSEPENVLVPVSDAISVVSFKAGGTSASDLDELVTKLRRLAAQRSE